MLRALVFLAAISSAGPHADATPRAVRLVPGARVRVSSPALPASPVEGELVALEQGLLVFRPRLRETITTDGGSAVVRPARADSLWRVPAARIDRWQVHRPPGERASVGAKVGGALGGLLALGLGAMIASDPFLGSSAGGTTIFIFGAVGGLAGAGVGALVGSSPVSGGWVTLAPAQVRDAFARAAADSAAARPASDAAH